MHIEKKDGHVSVWWNDKYETYDDGSYHGGTRKIGPDLVLEEAQANALVIEILRGPLGYTGPMGSPGNCFCGPLA